VFDQFVFSLLILFLLGENQPNFFLVGLFQLLALKLFLHLNKSLHFQALSLLFFLRMLDCFRRLFLSLQMLGLSAFPHFYFQILRSSRTLESFLRLRFSSLSSYARS